MPTQPPSVLVVLSSATRRGAEVQGAGLAAELVRRGIPAEIVALRPAAGGGSLHVELVGNGTYWSLKTLRTLRRRARRFDMVIGYGSVTLPALSVATIGLRTRFVYRSIGDPRNWARGRLHRFRTRLLYRGTDHVAALFEDAAKSIEALYGFPADQISVIPNARDSGHFQLPSSCERAAARRRFGVASDALVVAQVGSFGPEKRVPLGIKAVGSLPDAHLLVAGDGAERELVRAAADGVGDRIHLLGNISDIKIVYDAADMVLSTSSTEGMPGVVIEAALCGVPAVVSDVGASRQAVGPSGRVVRADGSAEEFADAMLDLMRADLDPHEVRRSSVEQFSWEHVGSHWIALLERLSV
jgi:glycosyltransferase involved in cell wall biosynthesis